MIRAYYEARGEPEKAVSPVQRLPYVSERAIGALGFHPAEVVAFVREELDRRAATLASGG